MHCTMMTKQITSKIYDCILNLLTFKKKKKYIKPTDIQKKKKKKDIQLFESGSTFTVR